eukprot:TRINITY_DN2338_c0_g1_i2.p1 TRINITY_DN2338_c0_g1~~TRINITY_DN2338_c0_g1_i2.p1  ORF type:complete len:148 (-),score=30.63 TRINITY_DN2338_c0_g1_i2:352-795(-)
MEADLLRRTLIGLLVENEALRSALQGQPAEAPQKEMVTSVPTAPASEAMPQYIAPPRGFSQEGRKLAVARYREKRKRRLAKTQLAGPRYVKMKAVADNKMRNAAGKFVKKDLVVRSDLVETDDVMIAPQICEVTIQPSAVSVFVAAE